MKKLLVLFLVLALATTAWAGTNMLIHGDKLIYTDGHYELSIGGPTLAADGTITLPSSGTLTTSTGSETLTNKTLTSPTITTPTVTLGTDAQVPIANYSGVLAGKTLSGGATITNAGVVTLTVGTDAQIPIANYSGILVGKTISGDATITNAGVITISALSVEPSMIFNGTDAQLLIGQGLAAPAYKTVSGSATITNAGVMALADNSVTANELFVNTISLVIASGTDINTTTATAGSTILGIYPTAGMSNLSSINSVSLADTTLTVSMTDSLGGDVTVAVTVLEP